MKKLTKITLLTICLLIPVIGQTEENNNVDENTYSESKSYRPSRKIDPYPKRKSKKRKKKKKVNKEKLDLDKISLSQQSKIVRIPISVYGKDRKYLYDLKQAELEIFEDGIKQEITKFGISEEPLTIVLLFDTSPSVNILLDNMKKYATQFVDKMSLEHKIVVAKFDRDLRVLSNSEKDKKRTFKSIRNLKLGVGTSIYDSVKVLKSKDIKNIDGQKLIVLISDAVDTTSEKYGYDSSITKAEESNAIYYGIYFNTRKVAMLRRGVGRSGRFGNLIVNSRGRGLGTTNREYRLGNQYIKELIASTGGKMVSIGSKKDKIKEAFEKISEMINKQNFIEYESKSDKMGRKEIKVRIKRPNMFVRIRDNYYFHKK